jgi:hypothetical protein
MPATRTDIEFCAEVEKPFDLIPVEPSPDTRFRLPESMRDKVLVDVIHAGNVIPDAFMTDGKGKTIRPERIQAAYVRERDWGAPLVARALASLLGLPGYHRIKIARTLLDFGRFPGVTPHGAKHTERMAINRPFSHLLSHPQKRQLLTNIYDRISDAMEAAIEGKLIKIAIHTYDRRNPSGAERPEFSVITRSEGIEREQPGYITAFDPLYPRELGEFTADPVLRDRISLTLQKKGLFVEPNYPYSLPEGSLEVRARVWAFFRELRRRFEIERPEAADDPDFGMVWDMLNDTNLRRAESEMLRSYLHMYRRAPEYSDGRLEGALDAYVQVGDFLRRGRGRIISEYRDSPIRLNAMALEVRKDLLWDFDSRGRPIEPHQEEALLFAGAIAEGVVTYLSDDCSVEYGA